MKSFIAAVVAGFAAGLNAAGYCSEGGLSLKPGERVEGNVYYSDVRWTKRVWGGVRNALTNSHTLGGGRFFSHGRIVVRPDRWLKGTTFVEVAGVKGDWCRAGIVEKGKFFDAVLPEEVFPAETLSVRFCGEKGSSYEQNGYSLDLGFTGEPVWKTSSTNVFYTATSGAWLASGVWTVDALRKVPRFGGLPDRAAKARAVKLALAANETEAVQLVLSPQADIGGVRVDVNLEGPLESEVLAVDWRRVTHPTDRTGVTGFWPDPLRVQKSEGLSVAKGSNRAFWLRVRAPKATAKGVYRGTISVRSGEKILHRFPFEVEVFGFELPDKMTCLTSFNIGVDKLKKAGCDIKAFRETQKRHHMMQFGTCTPYAYVFDEPSTSQYPIVRARCEQSKRDRPHLKRMVTEPPCPELQGYVDIWCPRTDDYSREAAEAARRRGEDYWWYICCGPKAPFAGLFIDRPGTELRTWLWQTWQEKITGVLIWHACWWSTARDNNGDGTFFWKDDQGKPVDTFRAEAFRDGVEDYEYMAIYSRLSGRRYEVPSSVSGSLTVFDRTGAALLDERMRLAREIEKLCRMN